MDGLVAMRRVIGHVVGLQTDAMLVDMGYAELRPPVRRRDGGCGYLIRLRTCKLE